MHHFLIYYYHIKRFILIIMLIFKDFIMIRFKAFIRYFKDYYSYFISLRVMVMITIKLIAFKYYQFLKFINMKKLALKN